MPAARGFGGDGQEEETREGSAIFLGVLGLQVHVALEERQILGELDEELEAPLDLDGVLLELLEPLYRYVGGLQMNWRLVELGRPNP